MTTTQASTSLGLMASAPRRAALRSILAPASVGVLVHTVALVALVGIRESSTTAADLIAAAAPLAIALGATAALAVIIARQLGCSRTRFTVLAGIVSAIIPLAGLIASALSMPSTVLATSPAESNDATRYLCLCLPFVAFAVVIALGSARIAGRQGSSADRG